MSTVIGIPEEEGQHLVEPLLDRKYVGNKIDVLKLSVDAPDGTSILKDCSFEVARGQIVGLIGPSGSGKSTLLRVLNRLWEPAPNTVRLDGKDITEENVVHLRRRVGMLFQSAALFEGTVEDNVQFGPRLQGKPLSSDQIIQLLQKVHLDPSFASKSIAGLSGGQQQRVALARTLANRPEVLTWPPISLAIKSPPPPPPPPLSTLDLRNINALDPAATHHIEESVKELCRREGLTVWSAWRTTWCSSWAAALCRASELREGEKGHSLVQQFAAGTLEVGQ
eukprot:jgi/Mesen1/8978/ME000056S08385